MPDTIPPGPPGDEGAAAPASTTLDYPPLREVTRTVEEWKRHFETPEWAYRAAFVANHWCVGLPLPASEYDAAIHAAQHGEIRLWPSRTSPTSP